MNLVFWTLPDKVAFKSLQNAQSRSMYIGQILPTTIEPLSCDATTTICALCLFNDFEKKVAMCNTFCV